MLTAVMMMMTVMILELVPRTCCQLELIPETPSQYKLHSIPDYLLMMIHQR